MKNVANTDESASNQAGACACILGYQRLVAHNPRRKTFICDDTKLIEAAEKEGFNVVRM